MNFNFELNPQSELSFSPLKTVISVQLRNQREITVSPLKTILFGVKRLSQESVRLPTCG